MSIAGPLNSAARRSGGPGRSCSRLARAGVQGRNRGGFTLVEILVSLVIISVCLVAVLGAFQVSMHSLEVSRDTLAAHHLLAEKLTEARLFAMDNPGQAPAGSSGRFPGEHSGYQWEQDVYRVDVPVSDKLDGRGDGTLYEVSVRVWRDGLDRKNQAIQRIWVGTPPTRAGAAE